MAAVLDGQSGYQRDGVAVQRNKDPKAAGLREVYGTFRNGSTEDQTYGSGGGASRFFLNAGYEQWELDWIHSVGLRHCGTEEA